VESCAGADTRKSRLCCPFWFVRTECQSGAGDCASVAGGAFRCSGAGHVVRVAMLDNGANLPQATFCGLHHRHARV
jgi:hypothetical protein